MPKNLGFPGFRHNKVGRVDQIVEAPIRVKDGSLRLLRLSSSGSRFWNIAAGDSRRCSFPLGLESVPAELAAVVCWHVLSVCPQTAARWPTGQSHIRTGATPIFQQDRNVPTSPRNVFASWNFFCEPFRRGQRLVSVQSGTSQAARGEKRANNVPNFEPACRTPKRRPQLRSTDVPLAGPSFALVTPNRFLVCNKGQVSQDDAWPFFVGIPHSGIG